MHMRGPLQDLVNINSMLCVSTFPWYGARFSRKHICFGVHVTPVKSDVNRVVAKLSDPVRCADMAFSVQWRGPS